MREDQLIIYAWCRIYLSVLRSFFSVNKWTWTPTDVTSSWLITISTKLTAFPSVLAGLGRWSLCKRHRYVIVVWDDRKTSKYSHITSCGVLLAHDVAFRSNPPCQLKRGFDFQINKLCCTCLHVYARAICTGLFWTCGFDLCLTLVV